MSSLRTAGQAAPPGRRVLAQPPAPGDRSGHRPCPARLCHLPGTHPHPLLPEDSVEKGLVWGLGPGHQCFITVLWFQSVDGAPVRHWVALGGNAVAQRSFGGCCASQCSSAPQQHLPSSAKRDRTAPGFTHRQAFGKCKKSHPSSLKQPLSSFLVGKMLSHELSFKCRGRSL